MAQPQSTNRPDQAGRKNAATLGLPIAGQTDPHGTPPPTLENPPVVSFVSLGCAKNLVDSERMLGQLAESGCLISGDESAADTVVVNTCGFLDAARQEALEIITELAQRKREGNLKRIVVAGCLVQRDGAALLETVPEIDALVGVNNREDVVRAVWRMDRDASIDRYLGDYHPQPWSDQGRLRLTPRHYAYVRISEGCNQKCTFCTIPSIRGPMHCKTPDELVAESRELLVDGTREIILIGQDTTSYGLDIGYGPGLAGLLRQLNDQCRDARWIRLMYVYPSVMTDEIIDAIAQSERIVKYIDIPLQHINDRMLKAMGRRVTRQQTEELLAKLRDRIPGVTVRTTFIVGFPGESDTEFQELLDFVDDFKFDAVGAFTYSFEPDTPAGRMKDQLPETVKQDRYDRLMRTQQEHALRAAQSRIGRHFDAVIDERVEDKDGTYLIARHAGQAPEVDSVCLLADHPADPGDLLHVECVDTDGYDLIVSPVLDGEMPSRPAH